MSEFDAIRPYDDSEVRNVLDRLIGDHEFIDSLIKFKLPAFGTYVAPFIRQLIRRRLTKKMAHVQSVEDFQSIIETYMKSMLDKTVDSLTISGLDNLNNARAHLFVSNHRDIAMDPAFVNWTLFQHGFTTLRIAIGDNLLTKPFASDLMRLNKSFIVNRSATAPREKLKAAKLLSKYVYHSIVNENENVWIAQREGRAKDGIDQTNPAIVSMLLLNKGRQIPVVEYVDALQVIPVSISYEYDPCDEAKAREIYYKSMNGEYTKGEHEDVRSIARGIVGNKGKVHLSFGKALGEKVSDAESIADELDRQILENYVLHETNCLAYELLEKKSPKVPVGQYAQLFTELDLEAKRKDFQAHVSRCKADYRETFLKSYANPVYKKLSMY